MKLTIKGIRHFLEELTKFFISAERMVETLEEKERQVEVLQKRNQQLLDDLEKANNQLLLVKDRARREAGIMVD